MHSPGIYHHRRAIQESHSPGCAPLDPQRWPVRRWSCPTYGGSGYLFPPQRAGKEAFGEFLVLARVEEGRPWSSTEAEPMGYPQVCWQEIQRPIIYQNPLYPSGQVMLVSWSAGDQSMARKHQVVARDGKQRTRVEHASYGTLISRKQPRQTSPRDLTTSRRIERSNSLALEASLPAPFYASPHSPSSQSQHETAASKSTERLYTLTSIFALADG